MMDIRHSNYTFLPDPYIYARRITEHLDNKPPSIRVSTSLMVDSMVDQHQVTQRRDHYLPQSQPQPQRRARTERKETSPCAIYSAIPINQHINTSVIHRLSQCGWYYPDMCRERARSSLDHLSVGHFLLRSSSDIAHKYTLSIRTASGVVNIRIGNTNISGIVLYHLDCSRKLSSTEKSLETHCVIHLIEQLVNTDAMSRYQFTDNRGSTVSLVLKKPVIQKARSLKHLSRLRINQTLKLRDSTNSRQCLIQSLPLPSGLKQYLNEYTSIL